HLICAIPEVASPQFHYQQYLPGGVLRSAYLNTLNLLFPGSGFNLLVANPHYNIIWRIAEAETMFPDDINVPMLLVGGWFDHNTVDNLRMIDTLAKASDVSVRDKHKILMGPWVHGGTGQAIVGSTQQGELTFPEADGWNNLFSLQFMDHYLRGIDDGWEEHERYIFFQMGDQNWQQSPTWPPSGVTMQNLYAGVDGSLNKESSTTNQNYSFVYDPLDPSPTVGGKTLSLNLSQGPYDQAEVEARGDNIILSSADLTSSLIVKGRIGVKLYIASDRFDTDIALRLTDVYPDGRSILLGESILRMRFRQGFSVMDTMFIQPGEIYPIDMQFDDLAHTFLAGHQVRVIITSSNYPHFNRNMNTGGDMYPGNNVDTLVGPLIARNSIWFGPDYPSRVELPVELTSTATNDVGENSGSLNISPNPATDQIEIRNLSGTNQIVICDHLGRNRFRQIVSGSTMIELPNLENGLYFIHSKDQHRRLSSGKFLVLR
ncbi:MAG: CocE/NonD family hydrolase, partial [Saprospiraceae bacterium]|nr:CocE/NonD family hydrolase [Saprospiraceae bacterium]